MAEPFISEIRIYGFNFPPRNWAFCDGQLMAISQNQALFSLLGTTYGGDGRTTFALPDLRSRVPVHFDPQYPLGTRAGEEDVTLDESELPAHTHAWNASSEAAHRRAPIDRVLALVPTDEDTVYAPAGNLVQMDPRGITPAGGSQPHANVQPSLAVNFCIALAGAYPSRS